METDSFTREVLQILREYAQLESDTIYLNGTSIGLAQMYAVVHRKITKIRLSQSAVKEMAKNVDYMNQLLEKGKVIYGINTGYGGSADVRTDNRQKLQMAIVHVLSAGFGETFPPEVVRGAMLIRANSVCKAYSGVRSKTADSLLNMLSRDVLPCVPVRGSISASGDLVPTSHVIAALSGQQGAKVTVPGDAGRQQMDAAQALKLHSIEPDCNCSVN